MQQIAELIGDITLRYPAQVDLCAGVAQPCYVTVDVNPTPIDMPQGLGQLGCLRYATLMKVPQPADRAHGDVEAALAARAIAKRLLDEIRQLLRQRHMAPASMVKRPKRSLLVKAGEQALVMRASGTAGLEHRSIIRICRYLDNRVKRREANRLHKSLPHSMSLKITRGAGLMPHPSQNAFIADEPLLDLLLDVVKRNAPAVFTMSCRQTSLRTIALKSEL